jgi:hypothetical protein
VKGTSLVKEFKYRSEGNSNVNDIETKQTEAQATLACGMGSLESILRIHNMKNQDEDNFLDQK